MNEERNALVVVVLTPCASVARWTWSLQIPTMPTSPTIYCALLFQVVGAAVNDHIIRITPSSPAVGYSEDSNVNFTCRSLKNVTWILPESELEFDLSLVGVKDSLENRTTIAYHVEGDHFVSTLSIRQLKRRDSGRYICRPIVSDEVYDFPSVQLFVSWKDVVGVDPNPVRSVHFVSRKMKSFVVPCFNHFPANYFSSVELALQKRNSFTSHDPWQTIDLSGKSYQTWSYADYKGILIQAPSPGEYRCGVVRFNGTCTATKWSQYTFFIVEGNQDKEVVDVRDQRPHILPSADPFLIYPAGRTFSLMCKTGALAEHQWNVNWRLPSSYDKDDYEHAKVKNLGQRVLVTLAKGNHGSEPSSGSDFSVLTVSNATYLDTGYYTCHRADNDSINARQYVFVTDWNSWLAAPRQRYVDHDKREVVLGCRPTHPAVQMSLVKIAEDGGVVNIYSPHQVQKEWRFALFEGFKLRKASWDAEGTYQCIGRKYHQEGPTKHRSASVTQDVFLGIRGIELMAAVNKSNDYIKEGSRMKLICRRKGFVEAEQQTGIKWNWTSEANNSITQRFDDNATTWLPGSQLYVERHNSYEISYIEWENVTDDASGSYQCSHPLAGYSTVLKLKIATNCARSLNGFILQILPFLLMILINLGRETLKCNGIYS